MNRVERKSSSPASLPPELLLEVFAEPIMFHRCYVALTGSVTAALVLSYASYASEQIAGEADVDSADCRGAARIVKSVPTSGCGLELPDEPRRRAGSN